MDIFAMTEANYYMTCLYLVFALFGWLPMLVGYLCWKNQDVQDLPAENADPQNQEQQNGGDPIREESIPNRSTNRLSNLLPFTSPTLVAVSIASFFQSSGLFVPIMHLPVHAINMGISKVEAYFLISAIGIASMIGRIFNGWLCSKPNFNVRFWNSAGLAVSGFLVTFCPLFTYYSWLVVFSVLFGLASSCTVVPHPTELVKLLKLEDDPKGLNIAHFFYKCSAYVGFFVAVVLYNVFGHYRVSFYVAGFFVRLSAVLCWYLFRINGWERGRDN
ncbi:monocarboxylate transporter 5-like [Daphnia carinata]|uniref:monocarboxylate transporter 5-like n=1 Tax=Daphnia carinata TaxID=120202 RepID=UPI00257C5459|nr:monocarboxylate transporter 5-like [Daphnia carinata]XP_059351353.1 monocarboxylate transporter 5-like [Daphnia carinata]XP_059351354.1 monocarboxylate transporter 5-like [Daphnia carinata]